MFGDHVVILSSAKEKQKSYRVGDQIGVFKIVSFDSENIVFDWEGKEVKRAIRDLIAKAATQPQQQAQQQQQQPSSFQAPAPDSPQGGPGVSVKELSASKSVTEQNPQLGTDMGGVFACKTGDNSPAGTVVNGYRKMIANTLMGKSCHWEKVN